MTKRIRGKIEPPGGQSRRRGRENGQGSAFSSQQYSNTTPLTSSDLEATAEQFTLLARACEFQADRARLMALLAKLDKGGA